MSFMQIAAVIYFLCLTGMAVHDTGQYSKHGPRDLYLVFIGTMVIGFMAGLKL